MFLRSLKNKCVRFTLITGEKITGFVRDWDKDFVKLSVAGKTLYVAIDSIVLFKKTSGLAC